MKTITQSKDGTIYQIERDFEDIGPVIIDIAYSGDQDENGNDILEFVYAIVEEESNKNLSSDQINQVNKELECGLEEAVILYLLNEYKKVDAISYTFDIGEWKHNPTSILYSK